MSVLPALRLPRDRSKAYRGELQQLSHFWYGERSPTKGFVDGLHVPPIIGLGWDITQMELRWRTEPLGSLLKGSLPLLEYVEER